MTLTIKKHRNNILLLMLISVVFCSIVNYYIASNLSGYFIAAILYISIFDYWVHQNDFTLVIDIAGLSGILFILVYALEVVISSDETLIYGLIFFFPIFLIGLYAKKGFVDSRLNGRIYTISAIAITISALMSVLVLIQYPDAMRVMGSSNFTKYGFDIYYKKGVAGFGVLYSGLLFVPIVLYDFFSNRVKKNKLLVAVSCIALLAMIIMSGYTIAILLLFLEFILYMTFKKSKRQIVHVLALIFSLLIIVILRTYLSDWIIEIAGLFKAQSVSDHFIEIASVLKSEMSFDSLDRISLIKMSMDSFFKSPIWGAFVTSGLSQVSQHSTFFDFLGGGGLICFIPYVVFCIGYYKRIMSMLYEEKLKCIWKSITWIYWIYQIINPLVSNYQIALMYLLIVPSSLFFLQKRYAND